MKIYIACDHRGVEIKKFLKEKLQKEYEIIESNLPNNANDDYPDFAFDICNLMNKNEDKAILICGTGIGISIAANKVKGIRCGRVLNVVDAKLAREHNDCNSIALSASLTNDQALEIVKAFLQTNTSNLEKHQRRVKKIISYEEGTYNGL